MGSGTILNMWVISLVLAMTLGTGWFWLQTVRADGESDERLARELLASAKERAELAMIIDLVLPILYGLFQIGPRSILSVSSIVRTVKDR